MFLSPRASTSILLTTEGEHGPRGSATVPSRRGTFDPPAAGGRQRPDAVPTLLRLRTVPAVPGRHRSPSVTAKRPLVREVRRHFDGVLHAGGRGKALRATLTNVMNLPQSQTEFVPWLLRRRERGADIRPAHQEDPHPEEKDPQVRGEVRRREEIQGRCSRNNCHSFDFFFFFFKGSATFKNIFSPLVFLFPFPALTQ